MLGLKAEHLELGKFIDHGLRLVRDSRLNRYTLGSDLAQVLIGRLRRTESLELAIERVAQLLNEPEPAPGPQEEPRDSLSEAHRHLKSQGKLPRY